MKIEQIDGVWEITLDGKLIGTAKKNAQGIFHVYINETYVGEAYSEKDVRESIYKVREVTKAEITRLHNELFKVMQDCNKVEGLKSKKVLNDLITQLKDELHTKVRLVK